MNIKVGMLVKFNTIINPTPRLGEVVEVSVIKDHIDEKLIGQTYYMVNELDRTIVDTKVLKSNIIEVYEKVKSPWTE